MKKVIDFIKEHNYLMILLIFIGFSISLSLTYSNFIVTSNNHKAAEMYIGELKYSIEIDGTTTNTLTVPAGEIIIDVKVNNLNPVDTYYKLLYLNNSNLEIKYFSETKDTDEVKTNYKSPNDSVTSSNTNNLKLFIRNNSDTNQEVSFSLKGGYINNTLSDISVPSGYSEITTIEVPSSNTYFCKTDSTLTQGLEYVNGQYTYRYLKTFNIVGGNDDDEDDVKLILVDLLNDGWSIKLTDKTSTEDVTSKLCTYINNKPIISMRYMFEESQSITLDLSSFDTSNVTDMSGMFYNSKATTLDLSSFDTSNVTDMSGMFSNSKAVTLDLSSFDTSNVTDMSAMFYNSKATSLNLSSFDTSKVTNMGGMFQRSQATVLDLSSFDTSNVTDMSLMFSNSQATTLNLSNFNTSNVTSMEEMFYKSQATTIDVSSFNTSNVTNMSNMFGYSQATTLDLSSFDTSNVTNMRDMFSSSKATTLNLSSFDTSKVINMSYMFQRSQATVLDLSSFDTSNVTDMSSMFYVSQATTLDLSSFNTSKVTDMSWMFSDSQATTLNLSNFNTSNVTNMKKMFYASVATTLDLSSFDTSNATNMSYMFDLSFELKTIYVSNKFTTGKVKNSTEMFSGCTSLIGGSGTKYNSSYTDKTYARIDGGTSNPGYFTDVSQKPSTFDTDDWATIVKSVKEGNTRKYKVGDTKTIDMGSYGTHTLRIANTSTPSECSTLGFSQTACGFVLEFADIITTHNMNDASTNVGGWPATSMRTFVNNDIYNKLPSDLKNGIIDTTVVSSHGSKDSSNFTSTDKLYLLAPKEIYSDFNYTSDTAKDLTRQLDYYKNKGVTMSSYSKAIKMYNSVATIWWHRSVFSGNDYQFYIVTPRGNWSGYAANGTYGVSPAFRIG